MISRREWLSWFLFGFLASEYLMCLVYGTIRAAL